MTARGRPPGSTTIPYGELYRDLMVLIRRGLSVEAAARRLGVSRRTAYRCLHGAARS